MYKLNDNTPYNTWLVTVLNTTTQYAQCNITVLAVRMQDTELQTDRRTDRQTLNPSWSGARPFRFGPGVYSTCSGTEPSGSVVLST
jgi:hypothetical protein